MLNFVAHLLRAFCVGLMLFGWGFSACAAEYRLPDAGEIQGFSQPALQFYTAGVAALDRVDYRNAYNFLAKSAQLQPGAVRLQQLTAGLAVDFGRRVKAEDAKNYYQTAIASYENILSLRAIEPAMRREVINKLKIAKDEMNSLAQRDVIREASGQAFVKEENKRFGGTPTPLTQPQSAQASDTAPFVPVAVGATPDAQGRYPGQVVITPEVTLGPNGQPINPGAGVPPGTVGDPDVLDPSL